jgi:hypothetical protein
LLIIIFDPFSGQGFIARLSSSDSNRTNHRADEDPAIAMPAGLVDIYICLNDQFDGIVVRNNDKHSMWQKTECELGILRNDDPAISVSVSDRLLLRGHF